MKEDSKHIVSVLIIVLVPLRLNVGIWKTFMKVLPWD